jgi:hypothetical protein
LALDAYPPNAGRASALARALAASVTRWSGDRIALIARNAISADCSISISRCISPADSDTSEGSLDFLTVRGDGDSGLAVGFQSKSHSRGLDDVLIRYSPVARAKRDPAVLTQRAARTNPRRRSPETFNPSI